jgi:hypothetical protein
MVHISIEVAANGHLIRITDAPHVLATALVALKLQPRASSE